MTREAMDRAYAIIENINMLRDEIKSIDKILDNGALRKDCPTRDFFERRIKELEKELEELKE